jgi:hypothetical protein
MTLADSQWISWDQAAVVAVGDVDVPLGNGRPTGTCPDGFSRDCRWISPSGATLHPNARTSADIYEIHAGELFARDEPAN